MQTVVEPAIDNIERRCEGTSLSSLRTAFTLAEKVLVTHPRASHITVDHTILFVGAPWNSTAVSSGDA